MVQQKTGQDEEGVITGFELGKTDLASSVRNTLGSRFLGLDVDPATKNLLDVIFNQFLPVVSEKIDKHGVQVIKDGLMSSGLVTDEIKAIDQGKKWVPMVAMGTVLIDPILSMGAAAYDTSKRLNDLRTALTPISQGTGAASVEALFGSNNEVVENARKRTFQHLRADVTGTLARAIATIPAFMTVRSRSQSKLAAQHDEVDLGLAMKDPAKLKEYLEKKVQSGSNVHSVIEEQKHAQIKAQRADYEKEYEAFKRARDGTKAKEEIVAMIAKDPEYAQRIGVGSAFSSYGDNGKIKSYNYMDAKDIKASKFLRDNPTVERAIEKQLKYRFVEDKKHGKAFDDTWLDPTRFGGNNNRGRSNQTAGGHKTMVDGIEYVFNEQQNLLLGKQKAAEAELHGQGGHGKSAVDPMNQGIMAVASLAGTQFHKIFVGDSKKELSKPIALDLITHLKKSKTEIPDADTVPNFGDAPGDISFARAVHNIFEQHQVDSKKSEIGSRYFDHLKDAQFSDKAIFALDDKDLNGYELAVKHIARALKEGQMDAMALINLVGQRKIVQSDGKHFGPKGSNGKPSAILAEIDKQCSCIDKHKELTAEQMSELLSRYILSEEEMKAAFAPAGHLKGEERAFMLLLLESQVQNVESMKKLTGLSESEMEKLHKQAQQHFTKYFDEAIQSVTALSEEEIGALSKYEITKEEIAMIRQVAGQMVQSGKSAEELLDGTQKSEMKDAVFNVLAAQSKEDPNFWQNRVKAKASEAVQDIVERSTSEDGMHSISDKIAKERNSEHVHGLAP